MGKPDWGDAPDWAKWLAQDANGSWGWYQRKPVQLRADHGAGVWDIRQIHHEWLGAGFGKLNPDWQSTLERRP